MEKMNFLIRGRTFVKKFYHESGLLNDNFSAQGKPKREMVTGQIDSCITLDMLYLSLIYVIIL